VSEKTGRCLSIQQPWAWLIVNGFKDIENRDWPTRLRGWIGIHAGKKIDREGEAFVSRTMPLITLPGVYETGGIVGRARLVDCVQDSDSEWFFGAYGFVLRDAEPLPFTPCRGQLGFFTPPRPPGSTP
jgi:hypothetical protein